VALVSDDGREARGLAARGTGADSAWWKSVRIDLEHEPSAIASAAFDGTPITIYDVDSAPRVSRRLAERVGAKSAAFVPIVSGARVVAVVVAASTSARRSFPPEEVATLEALAAEAALAFERTRSATQLEEALARERLVATIGRRVRSEHDIEALLRVAVEEVGRTSRVSRCFIRLGEPGTATSTRAEWDAPGVDPIGPAAPRLPVTNLAIRRRRTVASNDVENDPDLRDPALGQVQTLLDLGTKAVLATPIVVFDDVIGVFGMHRPEATEWSQAEISLAEAVAREVGLALHTAQLLDENRRRLDRQAALVQAAQTMTSELQV
jgi:GAF domain-containing protein